MSKRLRNTLLSVLFCGGLFVAWYQLSDQTPIPSDTHITYSQTDHFRLDIDAGGQVSLSDRSGLYHYKISPFALRRILRTFHRAQWFDRDILAYGNSRAQCQLGLTEDHRKAVVKYDCKTQASGIVIPVKSLEVSTRFRKVLSGDKMTLQDYRASHDTTKSLLK